MMSLLINRRRDDAGYTLVEVLVAVVISAILGGVLMSMLLATQRSSKATTTQDDLNNEARAALNRISRDLRQAVPTFLNGVESPAIISVQNPDGTSHVNGGVTSITFQADFDGNGCVQSIASDPLPGAPAGTTCPGSPTIDTTNPEVITYCWDGSAAGNQRLWLVPGTVQAGTCTPSSNGGVNGVQPLVSGRLSNFTLSYRSNLYRYDANGDGVTTWSELDAAGSPVGNNNGTLDPLELLNISGVVISVTTANGSASQTYQTQVDLRNMS